MLRLARRDGSFCHFCALCSLSCGFTPHSPVVTLRKTRWSLARNKEEPVQLPLWRHVRQRLSTQVVLMMVAILVLTLAGGFLVMWQDMSQQLNDQFENRALSIAQTLAGERNVAEQAAAGRPGGSLQVLATQVMGETGALFVVITNARGIRLTHPNPALIGTPITYDDPEPDTTEPFRTGRAYLGVQRGTLGSVAAG